MVLAVAVIVGRLGGIALRCSLARLQRRVGELDGNDGGEGGKGREGSIARSSI